jgi:AhpD family alkylhydroperoxidase
MYSPLTAKPLNDLVQTLLHDPAYSTLTPGERELIATYTSSLNECKYCATTHGAIAKYQLGGNAQIVNEVIANPDTASISDKLKALLHIAAKVRQSGKKVTEQDIQTAAAFSMFNRYVDGLAAWAPDDPAIYDAIGKQRATEGYHTKPFQVTQPQTNQNN